MKKFQKKYNVFEPALEIPEPWYDSIMNGKIIYPNSCQGGLNSNLFTQHFPHSL